MDPAINTAARMALHASKHKAEENTNKLLFSIASLEKRLLLNEVVSSYTVYKYN